MELRFEPLSYDRLQEALVLVKEVFPDHASHVEEVYNVSLRNDKSEEYWNTRKILEYWVVIDSTSSEVVAVTGLYQLVKHSLDEIWMGWYCVSPKMRGRGIGKKTLEWTIDEARKRGYKYFRLWTTDDPNEAAAQKLYDSAGVNIYQQELDKESGDTIFYRELKLKD